MIQTVGERKASFAADISQKLRKTFEENERFLHHLLQKSVPNTHTDTHTGTNKKKGKTNTLHPDIKGQRNCNGFGKTRTIHCNLEQICAQMSYNFTNKPLFHSDKLLEM